MSTAEVYVYEPPETCSHGHTEPVYVVLHRNPVEVGDAVEYGNGGRPVALMCTHCLAVLPREHGCEACEWVEVRRFCDVVPQLLLGRPCKEHTR